jgi:hypothetical protein
MSKTYQLFVEAEYITQGTLEEVKSTLETMVSRGKIYEDDVVIRQLAEDVEIEVTIERSVSISLESMSSFHDNVQYTVYRNNNGQEVECESQEEVETVINELLNEDPDLSVEDFEVRQTTNMGVSAGSETYEVDVTVHQLQPQMTEEQGIELLPPEKMSMQQLEQRRNELLAELKDVNSVIEMRLM